MIKKIISGGQTGGDMGGLLAGKALGLETGGHCPANWKTEEGVNLELAKFGLVCTRSSNYPIRTRKNISNSDGTIGFGNPFSPGMRLTFNSCIEYDKPYLHVYERTNAKSVQLWLKTHNIEVLNVAGNRESKNRGLEQFVQDFLIKVLTDFE